MRTRLRGQILGGVRRLKKLVSCVAAFAVTSVAVVQPATFASPTPPTSRGDAATGFSGVPKVEGIDGFLYADSRGRLRIAAVTAVSYPRLSAVVNRAGLRREKISSDVRLTVRDGNGRPIATANSRGGLPINVGRWTVYIELLTFGAKGSERIVNRLLGGRALRDARNESRINVTASVSQRITIGDQTSSASGHSAQSMPITNSAPPRVIRGCVMTPNTTCERFVAYSNTADFTRLNLVNAYLQWWTVGYANLSNSDFSKAVFENSLVNESNLQNVKFDNGSVAYTRFIRSDLRGATFSGAVLDHASFSGSQVSANTFAGVRRWDSVTCPDGHITDTGC